MTHSRAFQSEDQKSLKVGRAKYRVPLFSLVLDAQLGRETLCDLCRLEHQFQTCSEEWWSLESRMRFSPAVIARSIVFC